MLVNASYLEVLIRSVRDLTSQLQSVREHYPKCEYFSNWDVYEGGFIYVFEFEDVSALKQTGRAFGSHFILSVYP